MKKKYIYPLMHVLELIPEYVLAQSQSFSGSGADATVDSESDFDSFFGS